MEQIKKAHKKLAEATAQLDKAIKAGQLLNIDRDIILSKIAKAYDILQMNAPNFSGYTFEPKEVEKPVETPKPVKVEFEPAKPEPVAVKPAPKVEVVEGKISKPEVASEPEIVATKSTEPETVTIKTAEEQIAKPKQQIKVEESKVPVANKVVPEVEEKHKGAEKGTTEILSDKYKDSQKLMNEQIGEHVNKVDMATKLQNRRISDLSKAIGINDKHLFTHELFDGNSEKFSQTIKALNSFDDLNKAIIYLHENFNWSNDNESATKLIDLVRRKLM